MIDLSTTGEGQRVSATPTVPVDPDRLLREIRQIETLGRNARRSTSDRYRRV